MKLNMMIKTNDPEIQKLINIDGWELYNREVRLPDTETYENVRAGTRLKVRNLGLGKDGREAQEVFVCPIIGN